MIKTTKPRRPRTPMCDRLAAFAAERSTLLEFLDWLPGEDKKQRDPRGKVYGHKKPIELCEETPLPRNETPADSVEAFGAALANLGHQRLQPMLVQPEKLVLAYLGIDEDKLEQERRALLDYQRELNEK